MRHRMLALGLASASLMAQHPSEDPREWLRSVELLGHVRQAFLTRDMRALDGHLIPAGSLLLGREKDDFLGYGLLGTGATFQVQPVTIPGETASGSRWIQLLSVKTKGAAEALRYSLAPVFHEYPDIQEKASEDGGKPNWRLRLGPFATQKRAEARLLELDKAIKKAKLQPLIVR